MLFRLSLKNMKKSFKDYAIYFLTLILGVAIFYMFNSIDSQQAMLEVSKSTSELIGLMVDVLGTVSIFVAIVLGFLIVYANNFLIKRRKKEFGIYMTLGMGKRQISRILFFETILIGIISLGIGLIVGVFGSQLMSILVGKMFQANMTNFEFIFSKAACIKTCIYFGIMYLSVMAFNVIAVSRYKLIDLITAIKKNEKVKIKNPIICVLVFIIACAILGYNYYKVTGDLNNLGTIEELIPIIIMGTVSTFLIFWSLSGFILRVVQTSKNTYLKGTNMFVLRQINAKINTTVFSMTVICLLLFVTITVLSSALSLNTSLQSQLVDNTPVDINLYKRMDLNSSYSEKTVEDSKISISDSLKKVGFDMNNFKDTIEFITYRDSSITYADTLGEHLEAVKKQYPFLMVDNPEEMIKISDYNKVAKLYGHQEFTLKDNEYMIICDYEGMKISRDAALKIGTEISLNGKTLKPKYTECQEGFVLMSVGGNSGIIIVPDNFPLNTRQMTYLIANYNATTDEEKQKIEDMLTENSPTYIQELEDELGSLMAGISKISIYENSIGISSLVTFIAIYLGIIFLISSSAILALKELSESSDNKQRYTILRKIGVDEKMINASLFKQIGIFFMLPLILAIIHSIFGIQFGINILGTIVETKDLIKPIIFTVIFMTIIYGGYFIATYLGSKNIIKEDS